MREEEKKAITSKEGKKKGNKRKKSEVQWHRNVTLLEKKKGS